MQAISDLPVSLSADDRDTARRGTMSTGEQVDEQMRPRRTSERRSSLQQIEALKVRRASERRASVELSAELVDPARTRRGEAR